MGDALRNITEIKRYTYKLTSPTNYVEVDKAIRWAHQDYEKEIGKPVEFSDLIQIEAVDDEIHVWWEKKE